MLSAPFMLTFNTEVTAFTHTFFELPLTTCRVHQEGQSAGGGAEKPVQADH